MHNSEKRVLIITKRHSKNEGHRDVILCTLRLSRMLLTECAWYPVMFTQEYRKSPDWWTEVDSNLDMNDMVMNGHDLDLPCFKSCPKCTTWRNTVQNHRVQIAPPFVTIYDAQKVHAHYGFDTFLITLDLDCTFRVTLDKSRCFDWAPKLYISKHTEYL